MAERLRQTKKDEIVVELRRRIADGEVARGSRIPQQQLAEQFRTSITPVREALRELQAEGLLDGSPHRGVRVASADLEKVKAVYVMRRLVEPYVMQRAALRVSRNDVETASEINGALMKAHETNQKRAIADLNRAFHFHFYDKSGIPALGARVNDLWLGFPWDILQVIPGRAEESVLEHGALIDAMRTGELEEVAYLTEKHIVAGFEALRSHLQGPGHDTADPFELRND